MAQHQGCGRTGHVAQPLKKQTMVRRGRVWQPGEEAMGGWQRAQPSCKIDPPPLKWSALEYGFRPEEERYGEEEAQAGGRSSPSCARSMCWSRRARRWRRRSARLE